MYVSFAFPLHIQSVYPLYILNGFVFFDIFLFRFYLPFSLFPFFSVTASCMLQSFMSVFPKGQCHVMFTGHLANRLQIFHIVLQYYVHFICYVLLSRRLVETTFFIVDTLKRRCFLESAFGRGSPMQQQLIEASFQLPRSSLDLCLSMSSSINITICNNFPAAIAKEPAFCASL